MRKSNNVSGSPAAPTACHRTPLNNRMHSRGIALISAMMVIAIVASSSTWLIRSQIINQQRSERVINSERAFVIALGVEDMVRELLLRDLQQGEINAKEKKYGEDYYIRRFDRNGDGYNDYQLEKWSLPFSFSNSPVPGAQIRWCVHDLGGYVDLNLLANRDKQVRELSKRTVLALIEILFRKKEEESFYLQSDIADEIIDDESLQAWEELITSQGIGIDTFALESANALADWFDKNQERRDPGGAEIDDYLLTEEHDPYLPADGIFMAWTDEVRLVKGYHESNYYLAEAILPYVAAIPVSYEKNVENPRLYININTAPVAVVKAVLRASGKPLDEAIDEVFSAKMYPRYPSPPPSYYKFNDVDDFCSRIGLLSNDEGIKRCNLLSNYFFVTYSHFMQLDVELTLGDTGSWSIQSLFYRHIGENAAQHDVFVLQRSVGRSSYYSSTDLNSWRNCH